MNVVGFVLLASGLAVALLAGLSFRESLRQGDCRHLAYWWGVALVILPSATTTVGVIEGTRVINANAFFDRTVEYVGLAQVVNSFASPLLTLITAVVIGKSISLRVIPSLPAFAFLLVLLWGALAAQQTGVFMYGGRLALLVLVAAAVFVPRGLEVLRGSAMGLCILMAVSGIVAVTNPEFSSQPCSERKCSITGGSLFGGVADNANLFGILAALAVPAVYFGSRRYRLQLALLIAVFGFSSGSRSAEIIIILTLVLILLIHGKGRRHRATSLAVERLAMMAAMVAVLAMPLLPHAAGAFTGRAGLWAFALEQFQLQPWVGHGPDLWRSMAGTGPIVRAGGYSTHNQFLEILYVTGLVGLGLFVLTLVLLIRSWDLQASQIGFVMLFVIAGLGITERPWSLGPVDGLSWSLIVLLTLAQRLSGQHGQPLTSEVVHHHLMHRHHFNAVREP